MTTLAEAVQLIKRYSPHFSPKVGLILGSGLGDIADQITHATTIPFQALGLQTGLVTGHASLFVLGQLQGISVACLKGRLHYYEGVSYEPMCVLIRVLKLLGCHSIIITGAAGSLRQEIVSGDIMVIKDHINFQGNNPLIGPNDESIGPRFPSLENAYDRDHRQTFTEISERLHITAHQGTYLALSGPSFETPAEIRACQILGADAIGMSIVPDVIIARHCGLKVLGLAAISNLAVGLSEEKVTHEVTLRYATLAARKLAKLIPEFTAAIG